MIPTRPAAAKIPKAIKRWFSGYGWKPFPFQLETWNAYAQGRSGLIHAPTGMGKTLAVLMGPLMEAMQQTTTSESEPIRILWITPLRALANDTVESLLMPVQDLGLRWRVEKRTGDTSASLRAKQKTTLPTALVTTPESLSVLLSHADARERLATLRCVVVDEWHELLGTKRGVQTELCLARLRRWHPDLRTWGLSATLANLDEAAGALLGNEPAHAPTIVRGRAPKAVVLETLIPDEMERYPWGGHLGLKILPQVLARLEGSNSTLVFTNTRSQAELWYQAIVDARPEWSETVGLHHGSLDREVRRQMEDGLKSGSLRAVVCTSSLDLGVDFAPVDQVIQIGSPKGIARLLQRAGRSGHRPGAVSRIICAPTNAFEMVEFSAVRLALSKQVLEPRRPLKLCLDVLVQHVVTLAAGGGFRAEEALAEIRDTSAFADLSAEDWQWALDFAVAGGPALGAYPNFSRIAESKGIYKPTTAAIARNHRMSIGTITSDSAIAVRFRGGATLGSAEEYFLSRLKPGETFLFAGRSLELLAIRNMTAEVRLAKKKPENVPRWMGGRMPLSTLLADMVRLRLEEALDGVVPDAEMSAAAPILARQAATSRIPASTELLIEQIRTREGNHAFVYTFGGRLANEGLAALVAWRIGRIEPRTVSIACNDYGIELLSAKDMSFEVDVWRRLLSPENLLEDLLSCVNATELSRRRFRDIARIAGLVYSGFPGRQKSMRQVQASSGLLFDVFTQFDPGNPLLDQARREVLEEQLDYTRLAELLDKISTFNFIVTSPECLTPLAFPLWVEQIRGHVSSEKWQDRVDAMLARLEGAGEP